MVELVLSMPATARSSTDFSFSRVDWKVCEEAFSWLARLRREVVRVSCSRREVVRASSLLDVVVGGLVEGCMPVAFAGGEGVGVGLLLRLRRVDVGIVVAVLEGVDVDVAVVEGNDVVVGSIAVGFDSSSTGVSTTFTAIGVANNSLHSSSTSPSSTSLSSSSARASSSSRTLCIRLSSCLARAISACASCRRSSGFICGRERSSWERSVRA